MISLYIGHWPSREKPALWIENSNTATATILAWFVNEVAADIFNEAAKQGIVWKDEETERQSES